MAMAQIAGRLTAGPGGTRGAAVRHCRRPARPRAGRALLLLALLPLPAAYAREVSRDTPPAWAPFVEVGPDALLPQSEDLPRPADLSLVWYDPSGVLPAGYDGLTREVREIFRGLGVEVTWRVGGTFGGAETPEVPVILLASDPLGRRRSERVLGLVVRDQRPHRAVWVFQDNVRRALGLRQQADSGPIEPLARALGRVVAHEIVHAISPDTPHSREGLMQHAFGRSFLLGAQAPIDPRCAAAFVSGLAAEWQQVRARAAAGSFLP